MFRSPTKDPEKLTVWLVNAGEPLPTDGKKPRLWRMGMIAQQLRSRGHKVVWWSSTFCHSSRTQRHKQDTEIEYEGIGTIRMIHAPGYKRSVSVSRLVNHAVQGRKFREWATRSERPDVILANIPTLEAAAEATKLGKEWGVPVVVDIRDMWPELFLDMVPHWAPKWAKGLAKASIGRLFRHLETACKNATAITGTCDGFVEWGAKQGGRARKKTERPFLLAYAEKKPSQEDIRDAEHYWDELGIRKDGEFTACFFGSMQRHLPLFDVIEAARLMHQRGQPGRIVICGSGTYFNKYKQLSKNLPNVTMTGWINAPKIWTLMRRSSIGLAPYAVCNNFLLNVCNKFGEYLSAGLPVITTIDGAMGRILRTHKCGSVYTEGSPHLLADRLRDLAADPDELRAMSLRAGELFHQRFQAENVYARYADYLEQIAHSSTVRQLPQHAVSKSENAQHPEEKGNVQIAS